jgi:hypothetical protein
MQMILEMKCIFYYFVINLTKTDREDLMEVFNKECCSFSQLLPKDRFMGTCKVRNEIETKRNQSKRNETNRNETKPIETNETKRNETKIKTKRN